MSAKRTIRELLDAAAEPARRLAARGDWVRETVARWFDAQREMDDRCTAAVERLSEEEFERLCDAEEAKVEAIRAPLEAVRKHDRWPRHLHWGDV